MTDTFRQQMDRELGLLGIKLSEKQLEQFLLIMKCWWKRIRL